MLRAARAAVDGASIDTTLDAARDRSRLLRFEDCAGMASDGRAAARPAT